MANRAFSHGFIKPAKDSPSELLTEALAITETFITTAYGQGVENIIADNDFVYACGGNTAKTIKKLSRDLKTQIGVTATLIGAPEHLAQDDTYLYVLSNSYVSKIQKSNMAIISEVGTAATGFRSGFFLLGASLYIGMADYALKVNASTLANEVSGPYESTLYGSITTDRVSLFTGSQSDNKIRKRSLSTFVASLTSNAITPGNLSWLLCDDTGEFLYTSGQGGHNIRKHKASDLTLDLSVFYGLTTPAPGYTKMALDGKKMYCGDVNTGTVIRFDVDDFNRLELKSQPLHYIYGLNQRCMFKIQKDLYIAYSVFTAKVNEIKYKI